jgi:hypothetical protein
MAMARHLRYQRIMRTFLVGLAAGLVFLAACSTTRTGGTDAASDDGAPSDGEPGAGCGGFANTPCAPNEYCDHASNSCGADDRPGTCRRRPQACPAVVGPPICGCDGMVHTGECATYATGTDLNANGTCVVEATQFVCGYTVCEIATQYCRRSPEASGAVTFSCVALPSACSREPSCGCLAGELCGQACTGEAKGGLTVSCP